MTNEEDIALLKTLCNIHAPSGNEVAMKEFLMKYINEHKAKWKYAPKVISGEGFQDCILLVFGKPRTAVFAHMDSIGFMVRYGNQLIPIGGPEIKSGYCLKGQDSKGSIECILNQDEEGLLTYIADREIDRGTELTFVSDFKETNEYLQSCYMDNRLGVWNVLKLAEDLKDGIIVFSCWEEHGGGAVPYLAKYIYEQHGVSQALISDITWATEGVEHGKGCAISLRDRNIPRRAYVNRIIEIAKKHHITYQLEVESGGSSDGRELQISPYPFDWCFVGAPEGNVHSPLEKVHKQDIQSMLELYKVLMRDL